MSRVIFLNTQEILSLTNPGFICGLQGFIWCFLQGFWYRMLVDVKILELNKIMKNENLTFREAIKKEQGYDI